MTAPLAGLRVIDAASFLAGPTASTLMSDFGAEVLKVESPAGDGHRALSGSYPVDYTWQLTNRNKRVIALDFTRSEGRAVLFDLLASADVVIFNLRADQLRRFALDEATLRPLFPRLVVAHVSGYGLAGEEADRRAFDATAWFARTGVLDVMRDRDLPPPYPAGGAGDHATAMTLFAAILMALYRRQSTGEGAFVSTSLALTGAWANGLQLQAVLAGHDPMQRRDAEGMSNPFQQMLRTSDGRYVLIALATLSREWPLLARALGHPEWLEDARYVDIRTLMRHRHELRAQMKQAAAGYSLTELDARLRAAEINYSVVAELREVASDPQLIANGLIVPTDSDEPGYDRALASPIALSGAEQRTPSRAPRRAEHTAAVLRELGYDDEAVDRLAAQGIVRLAAKE